MKWTDGGIANSINELPCCFQKIKKFDSYLKLKYSFLSKWPDIMFFKIILNNS